MDSSEVDPIEAIPHRPPIRCVERLIEAGAGHAVAEVRAPDAWEPWLIEGLAQTAAMLDAASDGLLMASGMYLPRDHPDVVNSMQDFDAIGQFLWRALRFSASFNGGETFEPGGYLTDY